MPQRQQRKLFRVQLSSLRRNVCEPRISKLVQTGSGQMEVAGPDWGRSRKILSSSVYVHQIFPDDPVDYKNIHKSCDPLNLAAHITPYYV